MQKKSYAQTGPRFCNEKQCGACGDTQHIMSADEEIVGLPNTVMFDRLDWKSPAAGGKGFLDKCAEFKLPACADQGTKILFINHHNSINILEHPDPFGSRPAGSPATNADFRYIVLSNAGDIVELEWFDYMHGWTVIRTEGNVQVLSIYDDPPQYIYTICTFRRMPTATTPDDARDYVATIDILPQSVEYGKIVNIALGSEKTVPGNEVESLEYHHGDILEVNGEYYIAAPSLNYQNSAIDFFNLRSLKAPSLSSYLSASETIKVGASAFHTTHMNPQTGDVLISCLGNDDVNGTAPAGFVNISPNVGSYKPDPADPNPLVIQKYFTLQPDTGDAFLLSGTPPKDTYNYDFVIDPCNNILVCTSWGPPSSFDAGFNPTLPYGNTIRIFKMPQEAQPAPSQNLSLVTFFKTNFAEEGIVPLEVRRTHVPAQQVYFVGITLPGAIDLVYFDENTKVWNKKIIISKAKIVADCTSTLLSNGPGQVAIGAAGLPPPLNGLPIPLITDITLSEDDQFLYVSTWLSGVLLQYDVSNPMSPKLVGGVANLGGVAVAGDPTSFNTNSYSYAAGKQYAGGPQMLRLDAAGYHLYVTNSLFSSWDDQFYGNAGPGVGPGSISKNGGMMIKLNTGVKQGKKVAPMSIDKTFATNGVVEFAELEHPSITGTFTSRAHESHIIGVRH